MTPEQVTEHIRQLREPSDTELSEVLGVSERTIRRWRTDCGVEGTGAAALRLLVRIEKIGLAWRATEDAIELVYGGGIERITDEEAFRRIRPNTPERAAL